MTHPVNFLYLGGDKCGSTWMHHVLSRHPDVALARAKELFYFDRFYDKGPAWYAAQFPVLGSARRVGEICHDYLYSETALHRINRDLPLSSRFLITVRDPMERTLSHYKYLLKIGRTADPLHVALAKQPQIVEHSLFGKHVERAQDILGRTRVHVLPFGLLKSDPAAFGRMLCDALGVPFVEELPYDARILQTQSARSPGLVRVLRNAGWALRRAGAPDIVARVKSHPILKQALYTNRPPQAELTDLPDRARSQLLDRFAEDQARLRDLVPTLEMKIA